MCFKSFLFDIKKMFLDYFRLNNFEDINDLIGITVFQD